ncbi:MAG: MATE family efflux transporter [Treponema sp.]|nr:MATE family efflux transporter [Treponema sp.]
MTTTHSLPGFYRTLFRIAIPIMLQQLMQTFVNMLDTIMVGHLGAVELASVGLGNQIFFLLNMVLFGIVSGGSIFTAQYWGKKDIKGIHATMGIMFVLAISVALIFSVAAIFAPRFLISLYSKDPAVISTGASYLHVAGFSYVVMAVGFVYQFAFRSTEHVRLPMVATVVSFITNAILNYLLIFGVTVTTPLCTVAFPQLGVVGAGVATIVARSVELVIIVAVSYHKHYEVSAPIVYYCRFTQHDVIKFFKITLPVILNETLWGTGITIQNSLFSRISTDAIAAFNITSTVSQLTWVFFIGVGNAAAIIIGKRIGAGNHDEARRYAHRFAWFMPLMAVFIGSLLLPLSSLLPVFFHVEAHILQMARLMLLFLMCSYPFNAFNMCMIVGVCRSGGDTKFAAIIDLVYLWFVANPLAAIVAFVFHAAPPIAYLCLLAEQVFKALSGLIRLRSGKWLHDVTA